MNASGRHQLRRRPHRRRHRPLAEPRAARARGRRSSACATSTGCIDIGDARASRPRPSASSCAPPGSSASAASTSPTRASSPWSSTSTSSRPTPRRSARSTPSSSTSGRAIGHNTDWPGSPQSFARGLPDARTRPRRAARRRRRGRRGRARAAARSAPSGSPSSTPTRSGRGALAAALRRRFGAAGAVTTAAAARRELAAPRRRPRQRHARRHGGAPRRCRSPRPAAPGAVGGRRRLPAAGDRAAAPRPRGSAAARSTAAAWPSSRPRDAFRLFTGREPDPERMLRHFAALVGDPPEVRACASRSPPSRLSGTLEEKLDAPSPRRASTASRSSRTTSSAPRSRPSEVRARAADLGLAIDLYQPFRDFEAVPADQLERNLRRAEAQVRRDGATSARRPMLVCSNVSPARDRRRRARRRAAAPARRAGRRARHPHRLRGARLGPARQRVRPRLADRRRRPTTPRSAPASTASTSSRAARSRGHRDIPGDKIFFLQLADAPLLAMDVLQWSRHYRCFPGQGGFDLAGFTRARARGRLRRAAVAGGLQRRLPPGRPGADRGRRHALAAGARERAAARPEAARDRLRRAGFDRPAQLGPRALERAPQRC